VKTGQNIVTVGNTAVQKKIAENRQFLRSVVQTVVFCGRQNIALRGHRDDGLLSVCQDGLCGGQDGNFRQLLQFRVASGDKSLETHLTTTAGNASISKTTPNELIRICGELVLETITKEVNDAKFFAVLADDSRDIFTKEQLLILLRYPTSTGVLEKFVGFVEVTDTTGQALADKIWNRLCDIRLDPMNMRGQGYDGASNMSGCRKGVQLQAVIMEKNPLALYTHCSSHVLNLVIVKSCSLPQVKNTFGVVQKTDNYHLNTM